MRICRIVLVPVLLALLPPAAGAQQERDGLQLYRDFGCIYCHGISGHRGATGGALTPLAHNFESFRTLVRFPARSMPPYAPEAISDEQLRRVFDYLMTVAAPPEVEELDILRDLRDRYE